MIEKICEQIKTVHPRTRKAHINTVVGLLIKGGGMSISLLLVPITIDYLSAKTYGTWLTISSVVTMLTFFDIGIGNGLRNKLSTAIAKENFQLARSYVSTAYASFGILQFCIMVILTFVLKFIPWQRVLNTTINSQELFIVILITVFGIAIKLVLDTLSYILLAIQEPSISSFLTLVANLFIFIGTCCLLKYSHENLVNLAYITALGPVIVLIIASLVLYSGKLKQYKPSFRLVRLKQMKGILSLGYKFFLIQVTVIVIFYTDNLIIAQLFGPAAVTTYNVSFRYFNAINTIFAISIMPYWSAFTEAYVKNDLLWMNKTYRYLQKAWLALVCIVIIMIVIANKIYSMWLDDRVTVPSSLNVCVGLFVIISCWNNLCVAITNGVGKVRLQSYYSFVSSLINIPLAVYFGRVLNMGSAGVILGTSVSLLIGAYFSSVQANKILEGRATGIWNE